jgi:hypothetical protein
VGRCDGKRTVEDQGTGRMIILKCVFMKWDGGTDWIDLAQDRDRTIRIFSTSRRSVRILCGQSDSFSVSYTSDVIKVNETKINVVNIFVMTPIQISPGTVATADHTLEPITVISLAVPS